MASNKPYSLGRNGHARACDCRSCAAAYVRERLAAWRENLLPKLSPTRTVYVRAHWRRHPRHLAARPNTRAALKRALNRGGK